MGASPGCDWLPSCLRGRDFEVLVSGFLCDTEEELQKQFILINNTRPLPKALVYELLPQVGDLPPRMSSRSQAALRRAGGPPPSVAPG